MKFPLIDFKQRHLIVSKAFRVTLNALETIK